MSTKTTLDVTLIDSYNYEYTFKIDNPKSSVSRANVITAFQPFISNSSTYVSRSGRPFTTIGKSVITTIEKEELT